MSHLPVLSLKSQIFWLYLHLYNIILNDPELIKQPVIIINVGEERDGCQNKAEEQEAEGVTRAKKPPLRVS